MIKANSRQGIRTQVRLAQTTREGGQHCMRAFIRGGSCAGTTALAPTAAAAAPALSLQRFFDTRAVSKSPIDSAVLSLLDYNTVEATMIASAILVCLSGLMFTSSRFTGALEGYYQVRGGPRHWT